jgi:hypothetical protein
MVKTTILKLAIISSPAVANGVVYVGSDDKKSLRLKPGGGLSSAAATTVAAPPPIRRPWCLITRKKLSGIVTRRIFSAYLQGRTSNGLPLLYPNQ